MWRGEKAQLQPSAQGVLAGVAAALGVAAGAAALGDAGAPALGDAGAPALGDAGLWGGQFLRAGGCRATGRERRATPILLLRKFVHGYYFFTPDVFGEIP